MNNSEIMELYHSSAALLSKCTIENRDSFLRILDNDIGKPFVDITAIDLRNYIIAKKQSGEWKTNGTLAKKIALLRGFFYFLVNENIIKAENNPAKNLKAPRHSLQGEVRPMKPEEISAMLKGVESPMVELKQRLLFYLIFTSGMRANEICMIKKENISLANKQIFIPRDDAKGKYRERLVPISDKTKDTIDLYISKYPNNTEYLFVNRFNRHIAPHAVWRAMRDIYDIANPYKNNKQFSHNPHVGRHTFASRWIETGGDWHALRMIMGWKSFSEFDRYVAVSPEYISKAAAKIEKKLLKV